MTTPTKLPVPIPATIMLLGSGELGRELTISLKRLGCRVIAVDSQEDASAMQVADEAIVIDMSDPAALREAVHSRKVDLIVPEIEAIATDVLAEAESEGLARVVPNAFAVQATMDRQRIRNLAASLDDVRTSGFEFASSAEEVRAAVEELGTPAFVKPTMSSSGHGQSRVDSVDDAEKAWDWAMEDGRAHTGRVIVEEGIDFDYEITLLTVRWWDEATEEVRTSFCEPIGHRQEGGDYVESWQPMPMSARALDRCCRMAEAVTDALADQGQGPALGLFGVEFFIKGDDVWFSELSPRPHDTGMVTMATQRQSEFDLHALAILGLPISTKLSRPGASAVVKSPGAFSNAMYEGVGAALREADYVRIFGKKASRAGRRLGVALAGGKTLEEVRGRAGRAAGLITVVEAGE